MAVELNRLYKEIYAEYEVELLTESCFRKKIGWFHVVEDVSFVYLLHGGELIFNSNLNYDSPKGLKEFIDALLDVQAGGLVVAVQQPDIFTDEIIAYCNKRQFPLFRAGWRTSYLEIMHRFSEMIISDERKETNLIAALKNAIYYPKDDKLYQNHFERNGFFNHMLYIIAVLEIRSEGEERTEEDKGRLEKAVSYAMPGSIMYEEQDFVVVLTVGRELDNLKEEYGKLCEKDSGLSIAIGSAESRMQDIHRSYENAMTAYGLIGTVTAGRILCYEEIGVYQILADRKDEQIYPAFVEKTLGNLIEYDRKNGTDYLKLLDAFFQCECNLTKTAEHLFFHKNTLKYKMNAVREILKCDITANENRLNIMLSLAILRMGKG